MIKNRIARILQFFGSSGGGGSKEVVLWTNPNPSVNFNGGYLTVGQSLNNFNHLKVITNLGTQIFKIDDLIAAASTSAPYHPCFYISVGNNNLFRTFSITDNNKIYISDCTNLISSTTFNFYCIPLQIIAIK